MNETYNKAVIYFYMQKYDFYAMLNPILGINTISKNQKMLIIINDL